MVQRILFVLFAAASLWAAPAFAQYAPLLVSDAYQSSDFIDRIIGFKITNTGDQAETVRGRVVVLNVYDASPPLSFPLGEIVVHPHETIDWWTRWYDAPVFGQIRVMIILNEGLPNATVASHAFWLLPDKGTVLAAAIVLLLVILLVRFAFRLRSSRSARSLFMKGAEASRANEPAPSSAPPKPKPLGATMTYRVEPEDTVMTLSARFDVSWQELARANHLKPPYAIIPGTVVQIPRHQLKKKTPSEKA